MNVHENIRNDRKLAEKLRGISSKLPLHQLLNNLILQDLVPNKS